MKRGNQFWGESIYMEGLSFDPNPSANLVSVERGGNSMNIFGTTTFY